MIYVLNSIIALVLLKIGSNLGAYMHHRELIRRKKIVLAETNRIIEEFSDAEERPEGVKEFLELEKELRETMLDTIIEDL